MATAIVKMSVSVKFRGKDYSTETEKEIENVDRVNNKTFRALSTQRDFLKLEGLGPGGFVNDFKKLVVVNLDDQNDIRVRLAKLDGENRLAADFPVKPGQPFIVNNASISTTVEEGAFEDFQQMTDIQISGNDIDCEYLIMHATAEE